MDLINKLVLHKVFGEGNIVEQSNNYIAILFNVGKKKFVYPDSFNGFIRFKDELIQKEVMQIIDEQHKEKEQIRLKKEQEHRKKQELLTQKNTTKKVTNRTKTKIYPRYNIAFKCNYCDGGKSDYNVGFNGVCSKELIKNNIEIEQRTWCSSNDCPCNKYHNSQIHYEHLNEMFNNGTMICYECTMLKDWKASAGMVLTGQRKGTPMKLNQVQTNSLCVLTTRNPESEEANRYIFAVFLVDETYEGDNKDEGYVSTTSKYKLKLSPAEAEKMLFWNYHKNANDPENIRWSSGLHRYFEDEQAVQILRDIASLKHGTDDSELAIEFLDYFCKINGFNIEDASEPSGSLTLV